MVTTVRDFDALCVKGFTPLDQNPEIIAGCRVIAQLISSMTIYLMANTEKGDIRIKNELSRAVDIYPWRDMTRRTWMDAIIMNLLLYGNGNSVVLPHTKNGYLDGLEPIPASQVSFSPTEGGYRVIIGGREYEPDDVLHFVHNPDKEYLWRGQGLRVALRDLASNLKQAQETTKGFLGSKWQPSLIIKVDALIDEFSSPDGRKRLMQEYVETSERGEPLLIPADQFSVETVRPLSLQDLAISDVVTLDKRSVASILGIPAFLLGVGDFNADAFNAFVNNTIRPIAREIEQEMTRKLLVSPKMYWMFNMASLYSYDLKTLADVYKELYNSGLVTGNEVRDKLSLEPLEGLDELVILENYIPVAKIGDQLKLKQEE